MKYIDVSEHQGLVDWETVRGNVDGAILRAGYGRTADAQFARNAAECNRLGIPCGAYWFSYACSAAEAEAEARRLLDAAAPYRMELPLAFDFEYASVEHAKKRGVTVTKDLATDMACVFCDTVEKGGYWALNYANPDFLSRWFDETVPLRFGLWLAQWPKKPDPAKPPRPCAIWQWTNKGRVPGVQGDVDVSEAYRDFAAVMRETGWNRLGEEAAEISDEKSFPQRGKVPPEAADEGETDGAQGAFSDAGADGEVLPHLAAAAATLPRWGRESQPAAAPSPAEALEWAGEHGLLPGELAPEDALTLTAAAELLARYHRAFAGAGKGAGA